jgi:uncharacterized lipoprotein YddW (UPF0748 family)
MKNVLILLSILTMVSVQFASDPPKREFRAAWIATVVNLDWPKSGNPATQKQEMIDMLDDLNEIGINAVIFQVRTECDALYDSPYDPWSYWLTGRQGVAPSPYYDPLEFTVKEAHARGMEVHAWFNPYRAQRTVGSYTIAANHVSKLHPEWTITIGTWQFLDPGLPPVREYVTNVVMDVVNRYDVDGIHADDYFYPYPPNQITNQDAQTYADYNPGSLSLGDWRRENVNTLIEMIYDSVQIVKPHVKFGMSPFGIWKNGVPTGITGLDAYNTIYCDGVAWMQRQIVDYLTPQLYWPYGGGQDYGKLLPWWAGVTNNRHLYPGMGAYRIVNWPSPDEMPRMIRQNRSTSNVYGEVYFRAQAGLIDNPRGFADSLKEDYYKYPALLPVMDWKDMQAPNIVQNLRYEALTSGGSSALVWDLPAPIAEDDTAKRYAVYRFADIVPQQSDLDDPKNMVEVVGNKYYFAAVPQSDASQFNYVVTALDRNYNESVMSSILTINPPPAPVLLSPSNAAQNQRDTVIVSWNHSDQFTYYTLHVSPDPEIKSYVTRYEQLADSFKVLTGLDGQETYYWHVSVSNAGGESDFSEKFSFTTGFPEVPTLVSPEPGTDKTPLDTTLVWNNTPLATNHHLQFSTATTFAPEYVLIDTVMQDTSLMVSNLASYEVYFWRVSALNDNGASNWSPIWAFRTLNVSNIEKTNGIPLTYSLGQNYPNPFNPTTTIPFSIVKSEHVRLRIYDILGRTIETLVDDYLPAGIYEFNFDASNLPSGVYMYQISTNNFRMNKKMVLIK